MNKSLDRNFPLVQPYHPYLLNVMASATDEIIPATIKSTPTATIALIVVVVNTSLFALFA